MPGFISDSPLARGLIRNGRFLAARTTFAGDLTSVFTFSPIGPVEPTAQHGMNTR